MQPSALSSHATGGMSDPTFEKHELPWPNVEGVCSTGGWRPFGAESQTALYNGTEG
jgi:hypothetical protein